MENRSGLVVSAVVTHADGTGEREAAIRMLDRVPGNHPKTVGADETNDIAGLFRSRCALHIRLFALTPPPSENWSCSVLTLLDW